MPRSDYRSNYSRAIIFLSFLAIIVITACLTLPGNLLSLVQPTASAAKIFIVTNTNDSGPGSLRQQIIDATSNIGVDTITFDLGAGAHTITLLTALPNLGEVTISGPESKLLTVKRSSASGTPDFRIFTINHRFVNISGLTVSNGKTADGVNGNIGGAGVAGGGILNLGSLNLTDVAVIGNSTGRGGDSPTAPGKGGTGGGIHNSGDLTMVNCIVDGNSAGNGGDGGPSTGGSGGGIYSDSGNVSLVNTVISNNAAGNSGNGNGGFGGNGGGLYLTGFDFVQLADSTVRGNSSGVNASTPGFGGGMYNDAPVTVSGSTFSGNNSLNAGGGIFNKRGLTMTNTTVSGNQAGQTAPGGGIEHVDDTLRLTNCTIADNSASNLSGQGVEATGGVVLRNTIIAGNGTGNAPDVVGVFSSLGHNLIGKNGGSGFTNGNTGDQVGSVGAPIDPKIGQLTSNGGFTLTHALLSGSPAIDKGDPSNFLTTDQRGGTRPTDGDSNGTALVDIGAFEFGAGVFTVTKTADTNDSVCDADCSLREAIAEANSNGLTTNKIVFNIPTGDSGYNGTSNRHNITLGGTNLSLNSAMLITGPMVPGIVISGNNASRIFSISAGAVVEISNLALTNGHSTGPGGGINNSGTLTLINDLLNSNSTTATGGGIQNSGTLNITNSTISGNSAVQGGGIFSNGTGSVDINNSTVAGNLASQNGGGIFNTDAGAVRVRSSIIAYNLGSSPDVSGTVTSLGYNIVKDTSGGNITATAADQFNVDPFLEMDLANPTKPILKDNGGATQTIAQRCSSPAIDHGINGSLLTTDQRGFARVFDDNSIPSAVGGDNSDVGAVELQAVCTPTRISMFDNGGPFGGSMNLVAEMFINPEKGFIVLSDQIVTFTVNGVNVGSAKADQFGNATLKNVSLAGLKVGTYSAGPNSGITASFAGTTLYKPSSVTTSLIVSKASAQITLSNLNQTYDGTPKSVTAATVPAGLAVDIEYGTKTPPIDAGNYDVTASVNDASYGGTVFRTLSISRAAQTIAFGALSNRMFGDAPFTVSATASSGLPVSFIVSGPATISGNTVTVTGSGTVTVRAIQNGNNNYFSAPLVSRSFVVSPGTVKLEQTSYTVTENVGQMTINVIRTGDSSVPLSVAYATVDITALEHSDYNRASGTVLFAAGETSKPVTILINQDSYQEGTEMFSFTLSNPTGGATLDQQSAASVFINDDDTAPPSTNVIDDARNFVRQQYHDFLNREPDQGGLDYWTGQITQCGSDQACVRTRRIAVSNAFFFEAEYQQTGSYVFRLYRAAYGNNQPFPNPDTGNTTEAMKLPSYAVYTSDRTSVIGGANLAQAQAALANLFVQRPEFVAKYPTSLDGPSFVDALLSNIQTDLGVDLSSQRSALINLFNQGGRGAVLYRLADDNANNPINNRALIDAEYNHAFVITQYFGYLRRDPDIGGFLFWLDQINRFPVRNTTIQNAMVCSFITSREYQERFSPVLTHSNSECPQ